MAVSFQRGAAAYHQRELGAAVRFPTRPKSPIGSLAAPPPLVKDLPLQQVVGLHFQDAIADLLVKQT